MAQSAARKSHNRKVASSILSCRTFCHSNTGWRKKQKPTKSSTKDSLTTVLFRNAASTYKAPILHWCTITKAETMAQSAARKPHNREVVSSILTCRTFCHGNTYWRRKTRADQKQHSTEYSQTTLSLRNAASTYKVPITSLMHHNGDSDNGAVGSA